MEQIYYYKRVYIKTADDLPKEDGWYIVGLKDSDYREDRYFCKKTQTDDWLDEVDWYELLVQLPSEEEQIIYFNNHSATIEIKPTGLKLPLMTRSEVLKFGAWLLSKLK